MLTLRGRQSFHVHSVRMCLSLVLVFDCTYVMIHSESGWGCPIVPVYAAHEEVREENIEKKAISSPNRELLQSLPSTPSSNDLEQLQQLGYSKSLANFLADSRRDPWKDVR